MSQLSSNSDEVADDGESGAPIVTEPGSVVAPTQVNSKLPVSIGERKETVVVVEEVLVGAVGTLDFAIMPGSGDADELMADAVVLQSDVEGARLVGMKTVGKLNSVVGLYTSDGEREEANHLFKELNGAVTAELIEDHLKLHAAVLINSGVLIEFLSR